MKKISSFVINVILENPIKCLLIGILLSFSTSFFLADTHFDFGAKTWFRKNDKNITILNEFERTFGNDESIAIVLHSPDGVFQKEFLQKLKLLSDGMWKVSEIVRVESLFNYNITYAYEDDISTEPFLDDNKLSDSAYLDEKSLEAKNHPVLNGVYVDKSQTSAIVYGRIIYYPGKDVNYELIYKETESLVNEVTKNTDVSSEIIKSFIVGHPVVTYFFQKVSFDDLKLMLPMLFLLVVIYLWFSFKSILGVLIPCGIIFTSLIFTFGLTGLLGISINSLTFVLPGVLTAIGIADSVHVLATFYERFNIHKNTLLACKEAMKKNLGPIFLTTISTMIGFLSLMSSDIVPVSDMGFLAGTGTFIAFVNTLLITIPVLILFQKNEGKVRNSRFKKEQILTYIRFIDRFKVLIVCSFFFITSLFIYLSFKNEVNSNPYRYFKSSHQVSKSNEFIINQLGGVAGPELVIDTGEENGITKPEFLKKVESYQFWLNDQPYVNKAFSLVDVIKEVNKALHGGQDSELIINERRDVIAQELFLYKMGLPPNMDINNRVDIKNQKLRLSLLWQLQDSKQSLAKLDEITSKAESLGLNMINTGKSVLFQKMNSYVVVTFAKSMGAALLFITLILICVFKSFKIGLMSLIPNFSPIIFGSGLLYILGIPVDIGCAIVASVTLGIAVDDTIHFLGHYNNLQNSSLPVEDRLVNIFSTTGKALIITTIILVSSFGIFSFANLVPNINFGVLSAFVLSMALICDLVLLPAIILLLDKNKDKASLGAKQ